jgi:hypothetical protein
VWDGKAKTYTSTVELVTSCTTADLEEVDDAYEVKTTLALTFHPVKGATPPQLTGTYAQEVAPTDAGRAAGCTPFEDTGTVVGAPTDAMLDDDSLDVAGTYTTTEIVESVEPAGQRPPGFMGLLGASTIAEEGDGLTIAGVLETAADLTASDTGWSGATSEVSGPCDTTADGYASTETWTDLVPVALTSSGTPILAGRWELSQEPTQVGTDAGCTPVSNTGYVVLVPTSSLG